MPHLWPESGPFVIQKRYKLGRLNPLYAPIIRSTRLAFGFASLQCGEACLSVQVLVYSSDQPASPGEAGASTETMIGRPARQASPHCDWAAVFICQRPFSRTNQPAPSKTLRRTGT